jgi:hypothetical protein
MGSMKKSKSTLVSEKDALTAAAITLGTKLGTLAKRVGLGTVTKKNAKKKVAKVATKKKTVKKSKA